MTVNEKPVAAIRFEGTIATREDESSDWALLASLPALQLLAETYDLTVVSVVAATHMGLRGLFQWLQDHEVPYSEVWSGFCLPPHDVLIDDSAVTLASLVGE